MHTIGTFRNHLEASHVVSLLQMEGFEAVLLDEGSFLNGMAPMRVQVPAEQANEAIEFLRAARNGDNTAVARTFLLHSRLITMLKTGILNPTVLFLLARVRHTNTLVIADRGFPYWPVIETVDLSLVDDVPTVLQVLRAVRGNFVVGQAFMAEEFLRVNPASVQAEFTGALEGVPLTHEAHEAFKKRVPGAIGLIRTGDTTQYANVMLVSA